jgi:hypothetical protein
MPGANAPRFMLLDRCPLEAASPLDKEEWQKLEAEWLKLADQAERRQTGLRGTSQPSRR